MNSKRRKPHTRQSLEYRPLYHNSSVVLQEADLTHRPQEALFLSLRRISCSRRAHSTLGGLMAFVGVFWSGTFGSCGSGRWFPRFEEVWNIGDLVSATKHDLIGNIRFVAFVENIASEV